MLRTVYRDTDADEFGPSALKALRLKMIEAGNARRTVSDDIDRVRTVFRWAVSEELIDESVYRRLRTVEGLRKGLGEAKETEPIQPVSRAFAYSSEALSC